MVTTRTKSGLLIIPALAAVALSGCGAERIQRISRDNLQLSVTQALEEKVGQRPDKVECPDELTAKVGETTRCVLTAQAIRFGVSVTVKSVDNGTAKFDVQVDEQPM